MSYFKVKLVVLIVAVLFGYHAVFGHGMMLDPVSRSSRWRYNQSAIINKNDTVLHCGGMNSFWNQNKGKCGICGDCFSIPRPRPNELGGKYGEGIITKNYTQGQKVRVGIKITKNELGFFFFNVCDLDKSNETERCFTDHKIFFENGKDFLSIGAKRGWVNATILLPKQLFCKHCVLRWSYFAGNNWGRCKNGELRKGCGPQDLIRGCADISIKPLKSDNILKLKILASALEEFGDEINTIEQKVNSIISELEKKDSTHSLEHQGKEITANKVVDKVVSHLHKEESGNDYNYETSDPIQMISF